MKILHLNGFTKAELMGFKPVLHSNAIEIVQTLLHGCTELGIAIAPEHQALFDMLEELSSIETPVDQQLASELRQAYEWPEVKESYEKRADLQLPSSAEYIMSNLERYAAPDFIPSAEDVLRCRARTTGIHEIEFDIEALHFRMVDVGGQRSERKKWAHCFEDVTRIQEARKLFDDIVNSKWFQSTNIVLFLNKSDLFAEKIKTVDLKVCFSDYKGGLDYNVASDFIQHKFKKLNRRTGREIYTPTTCATDTENVRIVFNAVKETLITRAMRSGGVGGF